MEMMKKKLPVRDAVILVILALAAIGALYFFMVYRPTSERISALQGQQTQVQTEVDALKTKEELLNKIRGELEGLRESNRPVAVYDNQKPVMAALNQIMLSSQEFEIAFSLDESEEESDVVRRRVEIDFICGNYQSAKNVITALHDVNFRCQISAVHLTSRASSAQKPGDIRQEPVQGQVSIVFFESL